MSKNYYRDRAVAKEDFYLAILSVGNFGNFPSQNGFYSNRSKLAISLVDQKRLWWHNDAEIQQSGNDQNFHFVQKEQYFHSNRFHRKKWSTPEGRSFIAKIKIKIPFDPCVPYAFQAIEPKILAK